MNPGAVRVAMFENNLFWHLLALLWMWFYVFTVVPVPEKQPLGPAVMPALGRSSRSSGVDARPARGRCEKVLTVPHHGERLLKLELHVLPPELRVLP